ncbi:MAG: hypothetical protein ACSLFR_00070 [Solirubrobacteraceae bacterium]
MGFLKDVATAFKPSNIAKGIDAARNPPSQEEIEASLQSLTPEQRAKYDKNMEAVEQGRAEARASYGEAKAINDSNRVLEGEAGRYLHGSPIDLMGDPDEIEAKIQGDGVFSFVKEQRAARKGEFKEGLRQTFNISEVKELEDPQERARVAAAERAARDAARAPFRAPEPATTQITRIATRGKTQVAELLTYLYEHGFAAHPEVVFGVYRVPDRISGPLTPQSEKGRVVEWDIVHEPLPAGARPDPTHAPLVATSFRGDEQWVARRYGEPSVLDEDLGLAYCLHAGIAPERCLGLARISEFRALGGGSEDHNPIRSLVKGIVAIHPQDQDGAFERMRAAAPLELPADVAGPAGVHVEVLNWEAIGKAVHLKIMRPPPVPSPFPHLPATPQELLRAYLEIVGVRAADCYSTQATVDDPRELVQGGMFTTNLGPKQPCADGKSRMRTHGCQHVVFAYRDRPEYVAGRERWDAYMADALQAKLRNGLGLRPAVAVADDLGGVPTKPLRAMLRVAEFIDAIDDWGDERVPPYRYCWPAVETTIL